jgi:probable addiction module antidote protein
MPKRTRHYHSWLRKQLSNPVAAANYINAAIEDSPDMLLVAVRNVAEAQKMAKVASRAGVNRETLYRTLSEDGNPTLNTLHSVLEALGLEIVVKAQEQ